MVSNMISADMLYGIPEERTIITLDTGMSGTGIAVWYHDTFETLEPPVYVNNVYPVQFKSYALWSANDSWWFRASSTMKRLREELDRWRPVIGCSRVP